MSPIPVIHISDLDKPALQVKVEPSKEFQFRLWLYSFLSCPKGVWQLSYHCLVGFIIILGIFFYCLSTVSHLQVWSLYVLVALDILILAIFLIEFLLLLWASSCISKYQGCRGTLRFLFSPFRLLDLLIIGISIAIIWTHWIPETKVDLLWLRCGQIFQILRLERRFKSWRMMKTVIWLERQHLFATIALGFIAFFFLGSILYFIEQAGDPETTFANIPIGLWCTLVTYTSIGYGDYSPTTTAGRIVVSFIAILGTILWGLPAEILATGLALRVQENRHKKHKKLRRSPAVKVIQAAWRVHATSKRPNSAAWKRFWLVAPLPAAPRKLEKSKSTSTLNSWSNIFGFHNHSATATESIGKFNSKQDLPSIDNSQTTTPQTQETLNRDLNSTERIAVRFLLSITLSRARRELKRSFQPYDVKDVMELYAEEHGVVIRKVREMQEDVYAAEGQLYTIAAMAQQMYLQRAIRIDQLQATVQSLLQLFPPEGPSTTPTTSRTFSFPLNAPPFTKYSVVPDTGEAESLQ